METIAVEVIRADIAEGLRKSGGFCPVACALRRKFGPGPKIAVYADGAWVGPVFYAWSTTVTNWIDRFDNRQSVEPIGFVARPDHERRGIWKESEVQRWLLSA